LGRGYRKVFKPLDQICQRGKQNSEPPTKGNLTGGLDSAYSVPVGRWYHKEVQESGVIRMKTQGETESQISSEISKYYSQMFGRGPTSIRVNSINTVILIICQNLLTNSEKILVTTESGRVMIRDLRKSMVFTGRIELSKIVSDATGEEIHNLHHDFIVDGEESFIFSLEKAPKYRIKDNNGQGKLAYR
jgi:uncharacterized protein YbcI